MGITKTSFGFENSILIAPQLAFSLSVIVANTGVSANSNGRKIIKAGTPLAGAISGDRKTAFKVATATKSDAGAVTASDATCVALHDIDVTDGNVNSAALVGGYVDLLKLDDSVVTLINDHKSYLSHIVFVQGRK